MIFLRDISCLVQVSTSNKDSSAGSEMKEIHCLENAAMLFGESIEWIGPDSESLEILERHGNAITQVVSCTGKTVLPGFVDSHTHIVFAGNRSQEFGRRLQGVSYQQIASEGGGILSTVSAVRSAELDAIVDIGRRLALSALAHGTTTIEIKSGYGLSFESELKLLQAANILKSTLPLNVVVTFLGAHDFPPEYSSNHDGYVDLICQKMIPYVAKNNLAEYCDVFADTGYFTLEQSKKILHVARDFGLKLKIHADELSAFGSAELAGELCASSADHLLYISDEGIEAMKFAETVATLLPGTAYTLGLPFAPARKMIDSGMTVALATDCNPGSCYCENMQTILSLACTNMRMTIEESLTAATLNGAKALGLQKRVGSLEHGKQADFIICDVPHYSEIVYHFGANHVKEVWIKGRREVF